MVRSEGPVHYRLPFLNSLVVPARLTFKRVCDILVRRRVGTPTSQLFKEERTNELGKSYRDSKYLQSPERTTIGHRGSLLSLSTAARSDGDRREPRATSRQADRLPACGVSARGPKAAAVGRKRNKPCISLISLTTSSLSQISAL